MGDVTRPHPGLRLEQDGPLLTLTLDDPASRNAQVPSLWSALAEVGESLDPAVRVVVLRAEGPSFSAGLDRGMLTPEGEAGERRSSRSRPPRRGAAEVIAGFQRGFTAWAEVPAVVVAAVQGHAIGAGFQLALAATCGWWPTTCSSPCARPRSGLVPDLGGTAPLVRARRPRAGPRDLRHRAVRGRGGGRATGLANVAVPRAELEATTARPRRGPARGPAGGAAGAEATAASARSTRLRRPAAAEREAQARLLALEGHGP